MIYFSFMIGNKQNGYSDRNEAENEQGESHKVQLVRKVISKLFHHSNYSVLLGNGDNGLEQLAQVDEITMVGEFDPREEVAMGPRAEGPESEGKEADDPEMRGKEA